MNKLILTDVDGVIVDWLGSFDNWMLSKGYKIKPNEGHMYDLHTKFSVHKDDIVTLINEFNHSDEIANLKETNDSVEVISRLTKANYEFIAITSLSDSAHAFNNRTENLTNLFGDVFSEIICLPIGEPKLETLRDFTYAVCWVEDHVVNANAGVELGIPSFLMTQEHNKNGISKATRVHSWKDIERWLETQ